MARLLACFDLFAQAWTQDGKSEATAWTVSIFNLMVFKLSRRLYMFSLFGHCPLKTHNNFISRSF